MQCPLKESRPLSAAPRKSLRTNINVKTSFIDIMHSISSRMVHFLKATRAPRRMHTGVFQYSLFIVKREGFWVSWVFSPEFIYWDQMVGMVAFTHHSFQLSVCVHCLTQGGGIVTRHRQDVPVLGDSTLFMDRSPVETTDSTFSVVKTEESKNFLRLQDGTQS